MHSIISRCYTRNTSLNMHFLSLSIVVYTYGKKNTSNRVFWTPAYFFLHNMNLLKNNSHKISYRTNSPSILTSSSSLIPLQFSAIFALAALYSFTIVWIFELFVRQSDTKYSETPFDAHDSLVNPGWIFLSKNLQKIFTFNRKYNLWNWETNIMS